MITLQNCAIEPEIDDVISCLTKQGFLVKRDWRSIQIRFNRKRVSGEIHHYPINDRIEAASYAFAAAMFGVQAIIENAPMMTMAAPLSLLVRLGCSVKTVGDLLIVDGRFVKRHLSISVVAEPYPGFPTDLQPLFVALCTAQSAPCNIYDSVMPQRTQYVAALRALGANIIVNEFGINIFPYANSSTISGISNSTTPLALAIPDIRGGMAVILVALQTGTACRFSDFEQVRRGYLKVENIINKLGGEAREC
jgi:UDP-N-acetylglucosamine 1-carboxyvinyltransferase